MLLYGTPCHRQQEIGWDSLDERCGQQLRQAKRPRDRQAFVGAGLVFLVGVAASSVIGAARPSALLVIG